MKTLRLTAAQAMVKYLSVQMNEDGERFIDGIWAIFGHGNVAGLGEALYAEQEHFPTWRGQNEQTMAHTAIAYAKTHRRTRAQAVTTSIGPGATNLVTAAALAHVNRIPLLLIPSDVFANRAPDPVLQQIEDFDDGTVSANDSLRPVSRYFDRITRPEHIITALPRALQMMTDPANAGPATLCFCQDVQAEAYDYPESFFEPKTWRIRQVAPDARDVRDVAELLKNAKKPMIVAGGGVLYSQADATLLGFAQKYQIPIVETQAGKGAVDWQEKLNFGAIGVTGTDCANALAAEADVILGVGTRFQDFTTGSWTVFANPNRKLVSINVQSYDAQKHQAMPLIGDAGLSLDALDNEMGKTQFAAPNFDIRKSWYEATDKLMQEPQKAGLPTDAQVIGAVQRQALENSVAMCAAGSMPGYLHTLWRASHEGYHMEYGFSCMGYEIAGAMGVKLAAPEKDVLCFIGDGSYMMANSELATAVMRQVPFTVILTDNRGFGCINRLQMGTGGAEFNNLYEHSNVEAQPEIDFVAHAASMGAYAVKAENIARLEIEIQAARARTIPTVIVIDSTPYPDESKGGHWWEVGVPEVSSREEVLEAHERFQSMKKQQFIN